MGRMHVKTSITINRPLEVVFERLTDHEAMADWPGINACKLVETGTPRNGLGAVREVRLSGLTLLEKVVRFEPPHAFDYTITKGLPVDHLGEVRLSEQQGATEVTWEINLTSRWPMLCAVLQWQMKRGLPKALAFVRDQLQA